jgi:hypothetical protein
VFQKLKPPTLGQGVIQTVQGGGLYFSSSVSEIETHQHWARDQYLIQTVQREPYFFLAVFQNLKPPTMGHGVILTVPGGGLHFSSSVSEMEISNIGSGCDSNSARGFF